MRGYISGADGREYELPPFISWEFSHGFGSPCDSFQAELVYQREMFSALTSACRFRAEHDGQTVFCGVVDEAEISSAGGGCTCVLRGRGLQALLTDTEAESADYFSADLGFILRRHVTGLGIEKVDATGAEGRVQAMSVASGDSNWKVLSEFLRFGLGLRPRFSPDGTLVLDGMRRGRVLAPGSANAFPKQRLIFERCGVLTSALVKNRVLGRSVKVENSRPEAAGGLCTRVINVPRRTGFDAMRHTGEHRIKSSMEDMLRLTLTSAKVFACFPGDRMEIGFSQLGAEGEFVVYATRSFASAAGAGTEIELRRTEDVAW